MNCTAPKRLFNVDRREFPDGLVVPCGKCLNCRLQRRSEWVTRIAHESLYHDEKVFLTLTYDKYNVPLDDAFRSSLKKSHLQNFFKRLRKNTGKKIKYFACGEYGDNTKRPHYHAIVLGIGLNKSDKDAVMDAWPFCDWNNKQILEQSFGLVEYQSIRYVCNYVNKKTDIINSYNELGLENQFKIQSQGIGKKYAIENKDKIEKNGCVKYNGNKSSVPRYYKKITDIKLDNSKKYSEIKELDRVQKLTGVNMSRDDYYKYMKKDEVLALEDALQKSNNQLELNKQKKIDLNLRKKTGL